MPSYPNCLMPMMNAPRLPPLVCVQKQRQTWTYPLEPCKCGWSYICLRSHHAFLISRPLRFKGKKQSVNLVVESLSKSAPALAPVPTPTLPLNGYDVMVSPIVEQAEHRHSCRFLPASVVERSRRTPSPPLPIGCNWVDMWPAVTQPGPIGHIQPDYT